MANPVEKLQREAESCTRCPKELLFIEKGKHAYPVFQKPPPWPVRVLAVAEAPNATDSFDEDKGRLTLDIDETGRFQRELFESVGVHAEEVLFTNAVLCLPAKRDGKHPVTARQQRFCAEWLRRFIDTANPRVVITFGGTALQAVGRLERHGLTLGNGAGKLHNWLGRCLLPLYHPGRLGRVTRSREAQLRDISALREVP